MRVERMRAQADRRRASRRVAVAEAAQHVLGGVRDILKPRQAEEAAGALDRVDEAENMLTEASDPGDSAPAATSSESRSPRFSIGFAQEFFEKIVHVGFRSLGFYLNIASIAF